MSRCFPYPPPGFLKSNSGGPVVYEVLKEKQEEKHRDKKERKHKGASEHGLDKEKKHKHRRHKHERKEKLKNDHLGRIREETDQIEKSCLTEEHGQPVGTQNSPDSLDSVAYRGKRPRDSSSCPSENPSHKKQRTTCDAIGTHGKGLWIRLPILKNSERQQSSKQALSSSTLVTPAQVLETSSSIQRSAEVSARSTESQCKGSTSVRLESQYKDERLVAQIEERASDWFPPLPLMPSELLTGSDDLEWLFGGTRQSKASTCKSERETGDGTVWSQACYLPSADMHALPYVIPY